jgi:hypothetical protein
MNGILQGHVLAGVRDLARRFATARPFPHVVIDGFLREELVESLLREFPPSERGDCWDEAGQPGLKSTFETVRELGAGFARLDVNRCVVFETSETSWHGFRPIVPPADRPLLSRRSFALYFYTRDRPAAETAPSHATVYVERPLPPLGAERPLTGLEVAEVHRLTARRQEHAERLFLREQEFVSLARARLLEVLAPGRPPGSIALEGLRRLVECQDEALQALYRRETGYSILLRLLDVPVVPFSLEGPLALASRTSGCWADGWAGRRVHARVTANADLAGLVVGGSLPEPAGPEQELRLSLGTSVATRRLDVGDFQWTVACPLAPGATVDLEITATRTFCPTAGGHSEDGRELAWVLRAIRALPSVNSTA